MNTAPTEVTCSCGALLSATSPTAVPCDEFGMRLASSKDVSPAIHALVSCTAAVHGAYRPTFMVALPVK